MIRDPLPMPVDVPKYAQLEPFFEFIRGLEEPPSSDVVFNRGAVLAGGYVDMCKQVVGPAHLGKLCNAILDSKAGAIRHFLLGNNVAFDSPGAVAGPGKAEATNETREAGIARMVELMDSARGMQTWYLAGNAIDGAVMERLASALETNKVCKSFWLKRNPLGPRGARAVGRLLAWNDTIQELDLHNTGLLDEGIEGIAEELDRHSPTASALRHLHLGANAISKESVPALCRILRHFCPRLETLYFDMNSLGDEGLALLAPALEECQRLKRLILCANGLTDVGLGTVEAVAMKLPELITLGVGFYKSTRALGMSFNAFTDVGPLIRLVRNKVSLRLLKAERCIVGEDAARELVAAVKQQGTVTLFAQQQRGHDGGENVIAHTEEELDALRNSELVEHIFSIYRNNM